jgi:hypothetical protein
VGAAEPRELQVRFWLEEAAAVVESLACGEGDCLWAAVRFYRFPNQALHRTSCEEVCAEAGGRCAAPRQLADCASPDGPVALNAMGSGCAVYQGARDSDVEAVTCQDGIGARSGLGGNNRVSVACICEAATPLAAVPPLGIEVPAPGGYAYETFDRERVLMRVVSDRAGELLAGFDQPGYVSIYDANGRELASEQELNFGFQAVADIQPGTYYISYQTFPEFAQPIDFQVLW